LNVIHCDAGQRLNLQFSRIIMIKGLDELVLTKGRKHFLKE